MRYAAGNHVYELVPGWDVLPEEIKLQRVCGVAVDQRDRVFLYHRGDVLDDERARAVNSTIRNREMQIMHNAGLVCMNEL